MFLSLLFLLFSPLYGEVRTTQSFSEVARDIDSNTLLIFDIDNTILRPAQMVGAEEWFCNYLQELCSKGMDHEEALNTALDVWTAIEMVTKVVPIEKTTPEVIAQVQQKTIRCMAITTRSPCLAHTTIKQLASIGIDLNLTSPTNASFFLTNLPQVEFRDGILFTDGPSKGSAFKAFLRQLRYRPKKVIFIDDKLHYVEDLNFLEKEGIAYLGFHYVNENQYGESYDAKVAATQLEAFTSILSDNAARAQQ